MNKIQISEGEIEKISFSLNCIYNGEASLDILTNPIIFNKLNKLDIIKMTNNTISTLSKGYFLNQDTWNNISNIVGSDNFKVDLVENEVELL